MKILIKDIKMLLTTENGLELKSGNIFIDNDMITAVGEVPEGFSAERIINGKNKIAMPGLINCHTHTYMSVFRNLADDLSFDDWLFKNIMPREDLLTDQDAYWGSMLSCIEMIKTGTTCFLDMHMFKNQTAKAANDSGMRAVISRGLVGSDRNDEGGIKRVNDAKEEMQTWKENKRLSFMLAPHAIYTCGTDYLKFVIETAKELNVPLHTHLSETTNEVEQSVKNYGFTPTEHLDSLGFFDVKTVAAHCVNLTENDMKILKGKNVSVVHNPMSNLKLGNGFAPVYQLQNLGVNICLGTDSQASNNTLNLFSDMNFAALIHKGTNHNAQAVSAEDVLRFATVNGASALGLDNTGVIKEGKKADITIIDIDRPQFCPNNNLISALCYSANGSEVDTVIINGNIVLEDGKLTCVDEEKVFYQVNKIMERIK